MINEVGGAVFPVTCYRTSTLCACTTRDCIQSLTGVGDADTGRHGQLGIIQSPSDSACRSAAYGAWACRPLAWRQTTIKMRVAQRSMGDRAVHGLLAGIPNS